jgi:hypothetical protein
MEMHCSICAKCRTELYRLAYNDGFNYCAKFSRRLLVAVFLVGLLAGAALMWTFLNWKAEQTRRITFPNPTCLPASPRKELARGPGQSPGH